MDDETSTLTRLVGDLKLEDGIHVRFHGWYHLSPSVQPFQRLSKSAGIPSTIVWAWVCDEFGSKNPNRTVCTTAGDTGHRERSWPSLLCIRVPSWEYQARFENAARILYFAKCLAYTGIRRLMSYPSYGFGSGLALTGIFFFGSLIHSRANFLVSAPAWQSVDQILADWWRKKYS